MLDSEDEDIPELINDDISSTHSDEMDMYSVDEERKEDALFSIS